MNKRVYSKLPRPELTEEMKKFAKRIDTLECLLTTEFIVTDDETILVMNLYQKKSIKNDKFRTADYRVFFTKDDYITQDLSTDKVKWLTGGLWKLLNLCYWSDRKREAILYRDEDLQRINRHFVKYAHSDDKTVLSKVFSFQDAVRERRLKERRKKETDKIDMLMNTVGNVPKDFEDWVYEEALCSSQYLFYEPDKKGTAKAWCSCCKKEMKINRKEGRIYNNEKGICSKCGKKVIFKAIGRMAYRITDQRWVVYIEPRENGFVWRYFLAYREFDRNNIPKAKQHYSEYCRVFYTVNNGEIVNEGSYEWAVYKQRGSSRWCPDTGKINCGLCTLYYKNLPQAWESTPMRYSGLEVLSKNLPGESIQYEWAIKEYVKSPFLEWFSKMGLNKMAKEIINKSSNGYQNRINRLGKTIYEILKISKVNTRILQQLDGNADLLRLLQVSQEIGHNFKPEQLAEYYETFQCNTDLLKQAKRKVSLHKLVKYISKESERYPIGKNSGCRMYSYNRYYEREDPRIERKQNMANDWLEYLDWCNALKYDLNNMFIYMPTNFKAVHDRTAKEYQELQDKKAKTEKLRREREAKRKMEETKKAMSEIFSQNSGVSNAFLIKGKGLILRVPSSGEEIKAEGQTLHHCVGGYVERVAKGETTILFIRKIDKPDEPYFTLEWNNNRVIQCRGYKNCGMPSDVDAFVKVFTQKMLETINNYKKAGMINGGKKKNLQSA